MVLAFLSWTLLEMIQSKGFIVKPETGQNQIESETDSMY